jgi:YVTN family beta-propeller protein
MKMKFFYQIALYTAVALPFFTSCSKDDDPDEIPVVPSECVYVLNNGIWGSNNATLTMYDLKDKTVTKDIFEAKNNRRLGDIGQDIVIYGSKMYIAMSEELTIEVTDLEALSVKQIKTESNPRYFAIHGGKVYVTYLNGYVARIDTSTLEVEAKVKVGRNPEQMTVVNRKLYVANSGGFDFNTEEGYDRTVSVIDIASFAEVKKIDVVINPTDMESDERGNVYIISKGNYGDIPNTLQKLNTETDAVTVMEGIDGTFFTTAGNILYSVYSQWGMDRIYYYTYDAVREVVVSDNFIGITPVSNPYQINYDANYEHLFITASDYMNDGDVYIFDKSNQFVGKFEAGLNPMKAVYVKR